MPIISEKDEKCEKQQQRNTALAGLAANPCHNNWHLTWIYMNPSIHFLDLHLPHSGWWVCWSLSQLSWGEGGVVVSLSPGHIQTNNHSHLQTVYSCQSAQCASFWTVGGSRITRREATEMQGECANSTQKGRGLQLNLWPSLHEVTVPITSRTSLDIQYVCERFNKRGQSISVDRWALSCFGRLVYQLRDCNATTSECAI